MQAEGIAVVALTAAASIFILVLVLVQRNRHKWPKGYRKTTQEHKGYKVTVLTSKEFDHSRDTLLLLASDCAKAVRALMDVYSGKTDGYKEKFRHTVCWFKTDEDFEEEVARWNAYDPSLPAAHTIMIPRRISGGGLLGASVRNRYIVSVRGYGQPWAHELIHHLSNLADKDWDHGHEKPELWGALNERFQSRYQEIKRGA